MCYNIIERLFNCSYIIRGDLDESNLSGGTSALSEVCGAD